MFESFEEGNARRPFRILIPVALLTLLALAGAANLPIQTSRKALYPQDEPVLVRLESFLEQFGAGSDLMVVMEDAPRPVLERFSTDLAKRLREQPGIREASERLDTGFFYRHAFVMLPPDSLEQIRSKLDEFQGQALVDRPFTTDEALENVSTWLDDPPPLADSNVDLKTGEEVIKVLDFLLEEWIRWIDSEVAPNAIDWPRVANNPDADAFLEGNGYFASRDGSFLILLVSREDPSEEFAVLDPFIQGVRQTANALRDEYAAAGDPVPTVGITGLPATVHEEFAYVTSDILFIVATAGVLVMLLILFWMRSWRRALVIFIPMGVGTIWNAGVTYLTVGHLTMITAGFSAILFGLGVDYGIFMSSRILEEVRKGESMSRAVAIGAAASARPILTAGGCTVLIFSALITVSFKGYSDLGMVAATGVLMVMLSTFLVLPALFAVLRPPVSTQGPGRAPSEEDGRNPRLALGKSASTVVVVAAFCAAGAGLAAGITIPFNYNVMDLLPRESEAATYQKKLLEHSDFQPEIVIFTAPTLAEAKRVTKKASNLPTISRVQSIVDLFPDDMDDRVRLARRIGTAVFESPTARVLLEQKDVKLSPANVESLGGSITKAIDLLDEVQEQAFSAGHAGIVEVLEKARGHLEILVTRADEIPGRMAARTDGFFNLLLSSTRQTVSVLSDWRSAQALTPERLPSSIRNKFIGEDGSWSVYAYPGVSVYHLELLDVLLDDVYSVSPDATGFPTTHQVFSRMAIQSFLQGTLLAAAVALLWILAVIRNLRGFLVAALPLIVGEGWMLGMLSFMDIDFSYANIVGVPMVMALGVDYGVWYAHRFKELSGLSAWGASAVASRAILLAAGTTFAGLGAITFAEYRGVSMLGVCITIGLLCCVLAARFVSPAVAQVLGGRRA